MKLLLALAFFASSALAQYPAKPIRVLVPFGAGSSTDIVMRILAQPLSQSLGQPRERCRARIQLLLEPDRDVVELAGGAVMPALQLAAQHEPRTEAGSDREEHEVVDSARNTVPALAERGEVDVVLDRHSHAQPPF